MRSTSLGFLLLTTLAACGGTNYDPGGDGQPAVDAATGSDGALPPPARGFQVTSTEVVIQPGQEITYCYYFRTPNTEPMAIHKWQSSMTPGSHHMIMFTTPSDTMPPGTITADGCGFGGSGSGTNLPVWTYAAQTPDATVELPTNDGAGKPLAQVIPANSAAFFQMHYVNAGDTALTVSVTLNAEALPVDAAYTQTAAYVTYNGALSIPNNSTGFVETRTCNTPANTKFWSMSTHAHKQATRTEVRSGDAASTDVVFASTDWEHPGSTTWMGSPFQTFAGNKLTFACTYSNATGRTITSGDSANTDEMCMATGYMFPATRPTLCYCYASGCINI